MLRNPSASLLSLLLFTSLANVAEFTTQQPSAALAQSPTPSPNLPNELPSGTKVRIDGSSSMRATNDALEAQFEKKYAGTQVEKAYNGSDAALKALVDGQIDLAAIGRPLTQAEKDQGLVTLPVGREKLAIFVGPDNDFQGDLTFEQFARIFRGEITDWSQVGGTAGTIRLVDRPESSDTRRTLQNYSVFKGQPFVTGSTAAPVTVDETDAVVQDLGNDGIGYAVVSQVRDRSDLRIVPMHKTLPTDPRYPYSQPRYYVFKRGALPVGAAAFLGYLTSTPEGQAIIANETAVVAAPSPTVPASPAPVEPAPTAAPVVPPTAPEASDRGALGWLWYLIPFLLLALLPLLIRRRRGGPPTAIDPTVPPVDARGTAPLPPAARENRVPPPVREAQVSPLPPVEEAPVPPPVRETQVPPPVREAQVPPPVRETPVPPPVREAQVPPPPTAPADRGVPMGAIAAGAAALGAAAAALRRGEPKATEAGRVAGAGVVPPRDLSDVDADLGALPDGYGGSSIVLMPRDPQWAYTYWDSPKEHREALRKQGGQRLALRLYDVTEVDLSYQAPHSLQQYDIDELARDWYLPIPVSDRDYLVDIGYLTDDGRWLLLARSNPIRIPPVYPTDQLEDRQLTIGWDEELTGKTLSDLSLASARGMGIHEQMYQIGRADAGNHVAASIYSSVQPIPGSAQMVESSYGMASGAALTMSGIGMSGIGMGYTMSGVGMSGVGMGYTMSGIGMSGVGMGYTMSGMGMMSGVGMMSGIGMMSGVGMGYTMSGIGMSGVGMGYTMSGIGMSGVGMGYTMSGIGMSGVGMGYTMSGVGMSGVGMGYTMSGVGYTMSGVGYTMSGIGMSGVGFFASMPPMRVRKFWLVGDAELIIYGATEPDATLYIAGNLVPLNPDGTFRFHMSFQDGVMDFPILAIAADGEQTRTIHMRFTRETPVRNTNTKAEAIEEVF